MPRGKKQRLAITEMGLLNIPEPPEAFRKKVQKLVRDANDEARRTHNLPLRRGPYRKPIARGRCVGCGALLAEKTDGCRNCKGRHTMRDQAALAKT